MFEELLEIKGLREKTAAAEVGKAQDFVVACQQAVKDAEQAVVDYRAFRLKEEVRLFDEIKGHSVKVEAIDEMKFKITKLREKEAELEAVIDEKKKAVTDAEAAVVKAEEAHVEAQRAVEKFEEFVEIQREERLKEAAEAEEAEVEEISEAIFSGRMRSAQG
ncbi:MAG: YscO family type III secretion system apparatus protein [Pseudomonadota bacterium]